MVTADACGPRVRCWRWAFVLVVVRRRDMSTLKTCPAAAVVHPGVDVAALLSRRAEFGPLLAVLSLNVSTYVGESMLVP